MSNFLFVHYFLVTFFDLYIFMSMLVNNRSGLSMTIFLWHNSRLLSVEQHGQIQIPLRWWSCRLCWVRGIRMLVVESTWGEPFFIDNQNFVWLICSVIWSLSKNIRWSVFSTNDRSSELVQRIGINESAESMMAFNTNYKDTGLCGVYAVAKVRCLF